MDAEYSRKSGQIPAFGDWENANEMPITRYFECARQAGLLRCSCSGDQCGGSFTNDAAVWIDGCGDGGGVADLDGVGFEKPLPHRDQPKDQTKQFKVENLTDRPRNHRSTQNHYPKQSKKSGNLILHKSSVSVKPVDEDLYKISPELVKNSKRKKMLRFFWRCMVPSCAT